MQAFIWLMYFTKNYSKSFLEKYCFISVKYPTKIIILTISAVPVSTENETN